MSDPLRVVHYVNQFFGGIGGEDQADVGVTVRGRRRRAGPRARGGARRRRARRGHDHLRRQLRQRARGGRSRARSAAELDRLKPDVLVAGPAFGSGRYGLACAQRVRGRAGIGASPRSPPCTRRTRARRAPRRGIYIVPTGASTTSMPAALDGAGAAGAPRSARGETLGPAEVDGYLPQGRRRVHDRGRPGYQRALDMLLDKLHGRPYRLGGAVRARPSACRRRRPSPISRARASPWSPPAASCARAIPTSRCRRTPCAITGTRWPSSSRSRRSEWEAYHAGYFNHIVNSNPNYILPLSFLRDLERQGRDRQGARAHLRAARREHAGGGVGRARAQHRGRSEGGRRRRRAARRHLRDLQSLRRNDREGDRAGRDSGGDDLRHLQLRADDRRQPRDPRRAHRARVRRSHARAPRRTTRSACAS